MSQAAMGQIKNLLQNPFEKVREHCFAVYDSACLDIFVKTGILDFLAELPDRRLGADLQQLHEALDLDSVKLAVILRYLSTQGWLNEREEGIFCLTRSSLELCRGRGGRALVMTPGRADIASKTLQMITHPEWRYSTAANHTAFQLANDTSLPFFSYLEQKPELLDLWGASIKIRRGDSIVYLLRHILHNWSDDSSITILKLLAEAAGSDTKVLIIDMVIYPCIIREAEGNTRGPIVDLDELRHAGAVSGVLVPEVFLERTRKISTLGMNARLLAHKSRRTLLKSFRPSAMTLPSVLRCTPSSITFSGDGDPVVSSPETTSALEAASRVLHDRRPVVFPTETVYGLGALALNSRAVSQIFSTKGRPPDNPLIVHVSSRAMLSSVLPKGYQISRLNELLIGRFWPGPLTLLFPCDPTIVPSIVTAGQPTVAIRMPSHVVARALIAGTGAPLAAPSANSSGKPSPTRAEHVLQDLGEKVDLILDGGPCDVGVESTVVDALHEDGNVRILRPGGVTVEDIEALVSKMYPHNENKPQVLVHRRDYQDEAIEHAPTTPGMKYRHYSPSVPVTLLYTTTDPPPDQQSIAASDFLSSLLDSSRPIVIPRVGLLASDESPLVRIAESSYGIQWVYRSLGPADNPAIAAQRLFDGLLSLEKDGVTQILVEEVKEVKEGLAFMNRIRKAAGASVWIRIV
ncbi:Sua5/YciO/YrdC/YwlC family protein [Gloeophyllum trabeum ATCC 11539]|uniref:Threonylcarbamoyl-AMP synthase n=1 Tax=Gloeophyllum trabeum (strain ATCC 11539 / FP-39264 / Madison 617) TaxID=670483 RepID=S7S041_GLOTA|nr:Sua5/YciO/YrdC/YwlC family protein [Gloeophyllum trabeum ATCC 11539]EPQ59059.1 Sua5/YciO/YrdC/YwlC family protein [Gloeophyllum trabeum ATCC 11539]